MEKNQILNSKNKVKLPFKPQKDLASEKRYSMK